MRPAHIVAALLPVVIAATANAQTKPTIVLVHGAFADAAGWSEVIARLQTRGFNAVAVENDRAVNPDAEWFYAKRANATTMEVPSSHVVFLSHPDTVVSVIVDAATAAASR